MREWVIGIITRDYIGIHSPIRSLAPGRQGLPCLASVGIYACDGRVWLQASASVGCCQKFFLAHSAIGAALFPHFLKRFWHAMAEEDANVLLVLVGRKDNAAMEAVSKKHIANGGRLMVIYITEESKLSADFIDTVQDWNPPLADHTHHWYQIGPGVHTLAEQETLRICSNGVSIFNEEPSLFRRHTYGSVSKRPL